MLTSFSTALSAMRANETAIDVVGNNLANLNTPGFKASVIEFSDMISQSMGSAAGETQVGFGVNAPTTRRDFTQGAVQSGSGPLTAAIQGQGFFVFQGSGGEQFLTRSGNFRIGTNGELTSTTGEQAIGWSAVNGVIPSGAAPGPIVLPGNAILPPKTTANMSMDLNLDTNAADGSTFAVPVEAIDSLGNKHVLTVTFTRDKANNQWTYAASLPAGETTTGGVTTGNASAAIPFTNTGVMNFPTATPPITQDTIKITGLTSGAADMTINWSFFNADGSGRITQFKGESAPSATNQDGYTASQLLQVSIGDGGDVVASFSNGQQQVLARLAIAGVRNPETLIGAGNNMYTTSLATSPASIGAGGTGGRGMIVGAATEASTSDIAKEFANLIVYQRSYQAASRIITVADEISQETINLKR